MGYERYPRGINPQRDYDDHYDTQDYRRDYGYGRDQGYAGSRDRQSGALFDSDRGQRDWRSQDDRGDRWGQRDYGNGGYSRHDQQQQQGGRYGGGYGSDYHGSYASDSRRFEDVGNRRDWDDDNRSRAPRGNDRSYRGAPSGYDYQDRGFFARAGDEVRSWFGDDEAERRRETDMRYDERTYGQRSSYDRDSDYGNWRSSQIAALDRDYDEYRQENRQKFENEFSTWRTGRQGQRDQLGKVTEHMDVVGSDGTHVGTVDKVRGDRILLTKNDADAGGRHHSIPSRWIDTVDTKVTLSKTAEEAKKHWRDEESKSALFGYGDNAKNDDGDSRGRMLNRSFSGTY